MKPKQFMNSQKTIGYLSVSKPMPIYKKTPTKTIYQNHHRPKNYIYNKMNARNETSYLLNRFVSKKKYRGVLDVTSPGNKDVLIDSDSEMPNATIKVNKSNFKKNGCTKLVIEKVESQLPQKNNEYYKFTNQKRPVEDTLYNNNRNLFRYKSSNYFYKTDQRQKSTNFDLLPQSQILSIQKDQPSKMYKDYFNDTTKKRMMFNSSASNFYKNTKNLYDFGNLYKSNHCSNENIINIENNAITRSPDKYINTIEDNNSINFMDNYYINNSANEASNQDSIYNNPIPAGKNKKIYYIKNNNNNLYRNRDIGEESKKSTLYENYKDLMKMNIFSNITFNNNSQNTSKIILYPELKEKLIKIQSVWRGVYVRELMNFYWNLNDFKEILRKVFNNHLNKYFLFLINKLKQKEKNEQKRFIYENRILRQKNKIEKRKTKENYDKRLEEYIKALNQKEEDYDNLLKNYNSLVERCTELQQIINQKNETNINQIEINKTKKILSKQFDIIMPEEKDTFDIIDHKDKDKDNKKLLREKKAKQSQNKIERQLSVYYKPNEENENYLNRFKSNLSMINADSFNIKETPNINKFDLQTSNYELSLINNNNKDNKNKIISSIKEICHNESINLISDKKDKILPLEICQSEPINLISDKKKMNLITNICNNESFSLMNNNSNKLSSIKEICNNEPIFLIGNEVKPLVKEICKNESINIIGNKIKQPLEIINNESINIIGSKIQKPLEISSNESLNIFGNKKQNISEIIKNEPITIIGFKMPAPFEIHNNEPINIIGDKKEKPIEKPLEIINNEPINIIGNKKGKHFEKPLEKTNNESINIIGNKKEKEKSIEISIKKPLEIFTNESINFSGNKKEKSIEKPIEIAHNESINIIGNNKEKHVEKPNEIINNESIAIIGNNKEKEKPIVKPIEIIKNESINIIGTKKEKPTEKPNEITNNESIAIIGNNKEKEKPVEKTIEITNNESINIIGKKLEKPLEITNNESLNIIRNKKGKPSEIFNNESLYILGNKVKKPSEICNNESINLIGVETLKPSIKEICSNESMNILGQKKEKITTKEICQNEKITIINTINNIKQKIFDINKMIIDNSIKIELSKNADTISNNKNINKNELIKENQINLNVEIKGLEKPKTKSYKDCLINEQNNSINIMEPNQFNLNLMSQNNNININIINENPIVKNEKENTISNKEKIISKENIEQFVIEKKITGKQSELINNSENIQICENERFCLLIKEVNKIMNNSDLIVEKRDEIALIEKKINRKLNIEYIIVKKNNIFIRGTQKIQYDKITEITEELNRIEPNNHYELIFEGRINLNEDITKTKNIANNNNIIDNKRQELSYIRDDEKDKIIIKDISKNYNLNNEIDKCNALEINPLEIRRTNNNIIISHEDKLEVLYNKDTVFTEKAKKNMMKIILPIRLKTTLREFIHRNIFPLLISNMRKIAMAANLKKQEDNKDKNVEKDIIIGHEHKHNIKSKFYKNYCNEEMKKKEIKTILNHYVVYKWNKSLSEISKELINNKSAILEKIKNK